MDDRAFELPEQFILAKQGSLLRTLFKLVAALTSGAIALIVFLPGFSTSSDITEPLLRNLGVLLVIGGLYFCLARGYILLTLFATIGVCAGLGSYTVYMESPGNMQMMALLMLPICFGGFLPRRSQFWITFAFTFAIMLFTCWMLINIKGVPLEYRSITTLGMLMTLLALITDSLSSSYRDSIATTFRQLKDLQAAEARLLKLDQDLDNAVTRRMLAESVTNRLQRTGEMALEAAGATAVTINQESGELESGDEFFQRFGFSTSPATLSSLLDCIHPDDLERFRGFFSNNSSEGRIEGEFRIKANDPVYWMFLVEPVTARQSGEVLLQGIIIDVTASVLEQKRIVREGTEANESQRLESLGKLAGAIAHDFNNLLHVIMLNADLARQQLTPDSKPATSIDRLMTTVDRAAELCGELLAYSGRGQFSIESVNVTLLVSEMRHLLELSVPKGVTIEIESDAPDSICEADVTQLRQIIMNLVINAGDAVPKSNGRILVSIHADHLDGQKLADREFIESIPAGDYVAVTVSDNGIGMDNETRTRMFEPFFSTKETGHGLGLSAALGIVRSHKGSIEVISEPGKGTRITFLLPQVEGPARSDEPAVPVSPFKGTILFADDESEIRQLAKIVLEEDGYQLIEAEDGQQAIELFTELHEDLQLVILDLMMPNKTGLEAYIEIRQLDPSVPVVFSSGFNESDALQGLPAKARAAFLKKPYLAQDLRQFVHSLVGPRQL